MQKVIIIEKEENTIDLDTLKSSEYFECPLFAFINKHTGEIMCLTQLENDNYCFSNIKSIADSNRKVVIYEKDSLTTCIKAAVQDSQIVYRFIHLTELAKFIINFYNS